MKKSNPWEVRTIVAFVGVHSGRIHGFIDEPMDLNMSEEQQVELVIDSGIANYAEPSSGLEQRVFNALAERESRAARNHHADPG